MNVPETNILEQVIAATAEPLMVVRADHPEWPIVLINPALESLASIEMLERPLTDVIDELVDRELALEISQTIREKQETSFPAELAGREYLLVLKPLRMPDEEDVRYYAAFWRTGASVGGDDEMHHALLKAKQRIRDLSRDDPVTGLLNGRAFREVFEHDWAVARREKSSIAVAVFTLDDFDAYLDVFGRHAADSALRRVGRAIRRCLRRASDVVARSDDHHFLVLSHASDEANVREFAGRISTAVRELGLHHPRSSKGRFVTVSHKVAAAEPANDDRDPRMLLEELLERMA